MPAAHKNLNETARRAYTDHLMERMKGPLTSAGAAEVAFADAECKDEAGQLLPKIICFAHHAEDGNMPAFVHTMPTGHAPQAHPTECC